LDQEEGEEEGAGLAEALQALATQWPGEARFRAADVARLINARGGVAADRERGTSLRELLFPELSGSPDTPVTPRAVGMRLGHHLDAPVVARGRTLVLRVAPRLPGDKARDPHEYLVKGAERP